MKNIKSLLGLLMMLSVGYVSAMSVEPTDSNNFDDVVSGFSEEQLTALSKMSDEELNAFIEGQAGSTLDVAPIATPVVVAPAIATKRVAKVPGTKLGKKELSARKGLGHSSRTKKNVGRGIKSKADRGGNVSKARAKSVSAQVKKAKAANAKRTAAMEKARQVRNKAMKKTVTQREANRKFPRGKRAVTPMRYAGASAGTVATTVVEPVMTTEDTDSD